MFEIKAIISVVAIVLTFIGIIPYVRDIIAKKTIPHIYTWFMAIVVTSITFGLQLLGGAGVGAFITLGILLASILIAILALKNGIAQIKKSDTICLGMAVVSLLLWIVAKQPVLSIILITTTDALSFIPTIRKSWGKPYSETLFTYQLAGFRHGLSILALQNYNLLTFLYPGAWVLINIFFSSLLIIRRRKIK
jgi:hypothetical protein